MREGYYIRLRTLSAVCCCCSDPTSDRQTVGGDGDCHKNLERANNSKFKSCA